MASGSYRATKSGINAQVEKKRNANYSHADEDTVREWIDQILGEKLEGKFYDALRDGSKLCSLLNKLQPGILPEKHSRPTKLRIQQMEVIGIFIEGCKKYGMSEKDLFVTLDLYEEQNRNMVISSLFSLGRQAQKNGFEGKVIGPKEADPKPRQFSEEQQREGRNVASLQMGTNQVASQAGMTPYGKGRQIADTRVVEAPNNE